MKVSLRVVAVVSAIVPAAISLSIQSVRAACIETDWLAQSARNSVVEKGQLVQFARSAVQLKGIECRNENNESKFRVDFYRMSDIAAAMLLGRSPLSPDLSRVVGPPTLIGNLVSVTYGDLLDKFGQTSRYRYPSFAVHTTSGRKSLEMEAVPPQMRTFGEYIDEYVDYPNLTEIELLRRKQIPPRMNLFYSIRCRENDATNNSRCKTYDRNESDKVFWRPMTSRDADNYRSNLATYNAALKGSRNSTGLERFSKEVGPRYLPLAKAIAGENWPDDFLILSGGYEGQTCGGLRGIRGWSFSFLPRQLLLDVMIVRNTTSEVLEIDGVSGRQFEPTALRPVDYKNLNPTSTEFSLPKTMVPSGGTIVVPLRIVLPVPEPEGIDLFAFPRESAKIFAEVGADGFQGSVRHAFPKHRDYVYGREIEISSLKAAGIQARVSDQALKTVSLTISSEEGSCPYLLSREFGASGDWESHGKILNRALSPDRQMTEDYRFDGARLQFRLEEHEAERAKIDHVALSLTLQDGQTIELSGHDDELREVDGKYITLLWGDSYEFRFDLPTGVDPGAVRESRLKIAGYYERYSAILAEHQDVFSDKQRSRSPSDQACHLDEQRMTRAKARIIAISNDDPD